MREVKREEANYVVILSDSNKNLIKKIYFNLGKNEGYNDMLGYVASNYPDMIKLNTRVDFAKVVTGISIKKEF